MLFSMYGVGQLAVAAVIPLIFKGIVDTVSNPSQDPAHELTMWLWMLVGAYVFTNIVCRAGDY